MTAQGFTCPGCGELALMALLGGQAFCGNDDCQVFCWEPTGDAADVYRELQTNRPMQGLPEADNGE
jgi:hypothetical protein